MKTLVRFLLAVSLVGACSSKPPAPAPAPSVTITGVLAILPPALTKPCGQEMGLLSFGIENKTITVKDASGKIVGQALSGSPTCQAIPSTLGSLAFSQQGVAAPFSVTVPRSGFYTLTGPGSSPITVSLADVAKPVTLISG